MRIFFLVMLYQRSRGIRIHYTVTHEPLIYGYLQEIVGPVKPRTMFIILTNIGE
jgi:hypothetical protein